MRWFVWFDWTTNERWELTMCWYYGGKIKTSKNCKSKIILDFGQLDIQSDHLICCHPRLLLFGFYSVWRPNKRHFTLLWSLTFIRCLHANYKHLYLYFCMLNFVAKLSQPIFRDLLFFVFFNFTCVVFDEQNILLPGPGVFVRIEALHTTDVLLFRCVRINRTRREFLYLYFYCRVLNALCYLFVVLRQPHELVLELVKLCWCEVPYSPYSPYHSYIAPYYGVFNTCIENCLCIGLVLRLDRCISCINQYNDTYNSHRFSYIQALIACVSLLESILNSSTEYGKQNLSVAHSERRSWCMNSDSEAA